MKRAELGGQMQSSNGIPCVITNRWEFTAFVIMALIANGRQTMLLVRDAFSVVLRRPSRRRRRDYPRW